MSTGGPEHRHLFDPISGWCAFCNLRDDNRLIGKGGQVYRTGPSYDDQQVHQIREKATA